MKKVAPAFLMRLRAASVHWLVSLGAVSAAALLVFVLWYPYPFREIAGGTELFLLVTVVDVVMGPLLTLVIFDLTKPRSVLIRDLSVIAVLQLGALLYGLHTVYLARPVYLVHEVDRVQLVVAADVDPSSMVNAMPVFQRLPMWGVQLIGVREPRDGAELLKSVEWAMLGHDAAMRPDWWVPLRDDHREVMRKRAVAWPELRTRSAQASQQVDQFLRETEMAENDLMALPLVNRHLVWTIVLRRDDARVVGYLPIDPF